MKPIPYGRQNITEQDIQAVVDVLKSDFLTQGPQIKAFEDAFAEYIGCKYAVAVANGTAALHLCAMVLNVKENDKVITTPITFAASANCIKYCGGEVVFSDINAQTFLMDLELLERKLKESPIGTYKGIVVVDFAGYPVNLEKLKKLADQYGLWVIEDACHAPGAYFTDSKNRKSKCGDGQYADFAVFSFHPVKHIATGEGGMITTNNKEFYEKLLLLRTHGITRNPDLLIENHGGWYYEMQELGYNYRLTDILAALGISQLKRAESGMIRRQEIAKRYNDAFANTSITVPYVDSNCYHAFHLYTILIENRLELYNHLKSKNIHAQVLYIPVHLQPYYKQQGMKKGDFPIAEKYYEHCLSLPMFPTLTHEEQEYVIETILNFLSK